MSRKGENIHKRKDGRWEARIIIDTLPNRKYKSLYGKSYTEVKEKMINYYKKNRLEDEKKRQSKNIKYFKDVINEWFIANQLIQKPSTQLKYHNIADKHIIPAFGDRNITDVSELDFNTFLAYKLNNGNLYSSDALSPSYVKTMGIMLGSIINYAVSMEYRLPLKGKIIKPSKKVKEVIVMDIATQKKLENSLKYNISETSIGILLALNAGMRIGEICALSWDNIDFNTNIIHVQHTISRVKNNTCSENKTMLIIETPKTQTSHRDIPINSKLLPILKNAKNLAVSKYVVSDKDTFLSPRTLEYRFHKILKEYDIADINFHALRHTFATRCIELGVDIKTLSEILGHSNVSITLNTYVHSSIQLKREQLEKLSF